jgi:hypothetical protein
VPPHRYRRRSVTCVVVTVTYGRRSGPGAAHMPQRASRATPGGQVTTSIFAIDLGDCRCLAEVSNPRASSRVTMGVSRSVDLGFCRRAMRSGIPRRASALVHRFATGQSGECSTTTTGICRLPPATAALLTVETIQALQRSQPPGIPGDCPRSMWYLGAGFAAAG